LGQPVWSALAQSSPLTGGGNPAPAAGAMRHLSTSQTSPIRNSDGAVRSGDGAGPSPGCAISAPRAKRMIWMSRDPAFSRPRPRRAQQIARGPWAVRRDIRNAASLPVSSKCCRGTTSTRSSPFGGSSWPRVVSGTAQGSARHHASCSERPFEAPCSPRTGTAEPARPGAAKWLGSRDFRFSALCTGAAESAGAPGAWPAPYPTGPRRLSHADRRTSL